jgi:hypothetical protein
MLENKVLVNLYILSLGKRSEVFVPVNEKVGNISKLLNNSLFDSIDFTRNNRIINAETGVIYNNNTLIRTSDIKNGTKLILM